MKCFKNIRYALILFFMLLVGVASGGFFAPYKVTRADTQVKQNAIYQDDTKDSFAVVHNHTLATGVFEEGVTYYYNAGGSEYVELESDYYTIGDSIVDYESDVYVIASTYSVYKYESGNPVLICDTIECFGKSNAMDTYKNSYALLAIVDNATTHAIEINVGRTLLLTGEVYGTLTTQDYIYFYSDYDFYLYGSLQLTNENNTANYAIYLREGNLYTYANITSLSKPALVSAGSGSITVYGNISSNADATIHIPSSSYNTDALNVYANVENIAQGSAILNESQRQINLFEGRIKASGIALKNQSTGTVNASVNEYGLVIESTGSYAIYNNLSATIDLNGGNHILDIKANYNDAIYLNKGNLYAYHIQVENISPTGNIINAVNNGTSSVVNIDSVRFTLPNSGSGYHIYNNNVSSANIGQIYLSGASTFSGGNATIYSKTFDSVNAVSYVNQNNIYNGDIVSIACKGSNGGLLNDTDLNKVVVKNVSQANKHLFTLASGGNYALKHDGTSLKIGYVYRVTYMANGADSGQVPEDNNTYDRLATVTVLDANLQRVGYEFDGWTYNATTYKPNDIVSITQNITFVAKWKEKVYTMSYYVEDALVYTDTYTISTTTKTLYEDLSNPGYEV
ncbi:MAG: InlB B-repeat-containing protein, partial [Clostridia bacterium]|nr:InlB B-repeat-containing protein [Clostridia bacterium]